MYNEDNFIKEWIHGKHKTTLVLTPPLTKTYGSALIIVDFIIVEIIKTDFIKSDHNKVDLITMEFIG